MVYNMSFPGGTNGKKNLPTNAGDARDVGLITGLGRSPGVENILAWKIPWTAELEGYSPWGQTRLSTHTHNGRMVYNMKDFVRIIVGYFHMNFFILFPC